MGNYYPKTVQALAYRDNNEFVLVRVPGDKGGQILASASLMGKSPIDTIYAAGRLLCGDSHKDWGFASMYEQSHYDIGKQTDAEVIASLNESIGVT